MTERRLRWATMRDVARTAGVSKMTVSRALQDSPLVTDETRARIADAVRDLGYVPNLTASSLSSGRSRIVAAVVASLRNSQSANMLQGLGDRLGEHGCHLLVTVARDLLQEEEVTAALGGRRPDGIVLTGSLHSARTREVLRKARIRVVETWDLKGPFIDAAVGFDGSKAAWDMTRMLIGKGYRRIGYADFEGPNQPRYAARHNGFRNAMAASSLEADLVDAAAVDAGFEGGAQAIVALMDRDPTMDALVCGSDIIAAGAIFECQRRGWAVPGRVAVTGFGDFEIARTMVPRITTISTNAYALGQIAADLILMPQDDAPKGRVVDVGYELVIRESC